MGNKYGWSYNDYSNIECRLVYTNIWLALKGERNSLLLTVVLLCNSYRCSTSNERASKRVNELYFERVKKGAKAFLIFCSSYLSAVLNYVNF